MNTTIPTNFIAAQNKGGETKSMSMLLLTEYLESVALRPHLIDGDQDPHRPGTLKLYRPDAEVMGMLHDSQHKRFFTPLFERAAEKGLVVTDLGAGAVDHFVHWLRADGVLDALKETDTRFVMTVPVTANKETVVNFKLLWEAVGEAGQHGLSWLVFANSAKGEPEAWLTSQLRKDVLAAGGEEIRIPAWNFHPDTLRALNLDRGNREPNSGFHTIGSIVREKPFGILSANRVRNYQAAVYHQLSQLKCIQALNSAKAA